MTSTSTDTGSTTATATTPHHASTRRRWKLPASIAGLAVATAVALTLVDPFAGPTASPSASQQPPATATVTRRTLTSQRQVDATLGYAGSYSVVLPAGTGSATSQASGHAGTAGSTAAGTFTKLPTAGQVITRGHALYAVDAAPTLLLFGPTPAYRSLSVGMSGADVRELNANLVALGDANRSQLNPQSDYYSAATASAVDTMQQRVGLPQTGTLPLGEVVFLPSTVRVSSVSAVAGGPAQPGSPVLQATSTSRDVVAHLDANDQTDVTVGDQVSITLPDNRTTAGTVVSLGTVATTAAAGSSPGSSSSGSQAATIEVHIRLLHPSAAGTLDQAPVSVTITTGSAPQALTVPVTALLAQAGGGYAVEVVDPDGKQRPVPVHLGLFDDADGLVQVTGTRLSAGQRVVVPRI